MTNGLVLRSVCIWRGGVPVVQHCDLDVPPGGATVLAGRNGAGKSTLLRMLAGLIQPRSGEAMLDGRALSDAGPRGWLGHADGIKSNLSVRANLFYAAYRHPNPETAIATALERVDLVRLSELPARLLSAGQRRRLAIARLSLSPAPLWLLDEPSVGLDTAAIERLGKVLGAHRDRGGVVIAASHVALPLPGALTLQIDASPSHRAG